MLFGIWPRMSCVQKFWYTYMITYGNFMVFVESCNDSIIFNCFKDQTDQKRFIHSHLEMKCFNFKMKAHKHCIDAMFADLITVHEIYCGCLSQCCKCLLFNDFYMLLLE